MFIVVFFAAGRINDWCVLINYGKGKSAGVMSDGC